MRSPSERPAFDPFGEPVAAAGACAPVPGADPCAPAMAEGPGRRAVAAAFWIVALALVCGRVYLWEGTPAERIVAAPAPMQVVALP